MQLPPLLTCEEASVLAERMCNGDSNCRNKLIEGHLRLAQAISRRTTCWDREVLESDLFAEVIRAVDVYEPIDDQFEIRRFICMRLKYAKLKHLQKQEPREPFFDKGRSNFDWQDVDWQETLDSVCENTQQRTVLELIREGYTHSEIASLLGVSISKVTRIRTLLTGRLIHVCRDE